MAFSENRVRALQAAGAASAAAPYVRRIVTDDRLRDDVRTIVNSAKHLYDSLAGEGASKLLDDDIRKDVDRIMEAAQEAGDRVLHPRRTNWAAWIAVGAVVVGAIAGAVIYKPSREYLKRSVGMSDGSGWIDASGSDGGASEAHSEGQMAA
jgi:hypothetical protein